MKFLKNRQIIAVVSAVLSALLFAICIPFSKLLSANVPSLTMGGLLYLGAGIGLLLSFGFRRGKHRLYLKKSELPYIILMVLLDILAIIFLMLGIAKTTGANASLLGNFELVATALAAFLIFKEAVSKKLFFSIVLITMASIILTFDKNACFSFNLGSFLVLMSCICWGFENNCTRKLSSKDTRQITIIKGCFSGLGSLIIAFLSNESLPQLKWVVLVLLLGFVSYGISASLYIYAQRFLGAAKTGAFYSIAPFFGVITSLILLHEIPPFQFYIALLIMIVAVFLIVRDLHNS